MHYLRKLSSIAHAADRAHAPARLFYRISSICEMVIAAQRTPRGQLVALIPPGGRAAPAKANEIEPLLRHRFGVRR
jgi:hypothetical protein